MTADKQKAALAEIHANGLRLAGEAVVLILVVKELLDRLPPADVAEIRALASQRLQDVGDDDPFGAIIKEGMEQAIGSIFT